MGVALITGGSRGIGRGIAIALAKSGYDIAINYCGNEAAATETLMECEKNGVKAIAIKADVSKAEDVARLFAEAKEKLGAVAVLVNNAGITHDGLLLRMKESDFSDVIDTNLKGAFLCTKEAIKDMVRAKSGSIINIASIVGITGNIGQANYAASKAGLIGFTKSVAKEYGPKGICCNAIAPGFITTEMTESLPDSVKDAYLSQIPLKRFGLVEDVAKLVVFLSGDQSDYITGQVISIDGGMN